MPGLTGADYMDAGVNAALKLLVRPERTEADVRKAHEWLGWGLQMVESRRLVPSAHHQVPVTGG